MLMHIVENLHNKSLEPALVNNMQSKILCAGSNDYFTGLTLVQMKVRTMKLYRCHVDVSFCFQLYHV